MNYEINIEGMSCGHCVMAVKKSLNNLDKVTVEDVQPGKALVQIETENDLQIVIDAIEDSGYKVSGSIQK
ncbi:MAG: heavy-metal-associated domain-containing protein [Ignavibacteriales bacterium]|nr:MAG: heavy-metal-associated domain-containing protein [Ignavibacteriales bacterium]